MPYQKASYFHWWLKSTMFSTVTLLSSSKSSCYAWSIKILKLSNHSSFQSLIPSISNWPSCSCYDLMPHFANSFPKWGVCNCLGLYLWNLILGLDIFASQNTSPKVLEKKNNDITEEGILLTQFSGIQYAK